MAAFALGVHLAALWVYSLVPPGTPGTEVVGLFPGTYLGAHFAAHAVLFALAWMAAGLRWQSPKVRAAAALAASVVLNALIEFAQLLVPWRNASFADFLAGLAGALTCAALGWAALALLQPARWENAEAADGTA